MKANSDFDIKKAIEDSADDMKKSMKNSFYKFFKDYSKRTEEICKLIKNMIPEVKNND